MSRNRQSPLEDLIDIASKLSWKVDCALALASFIILHIVAGIKPTNPADIGQMGNFVVKQMLITLALFGQFVLPFVFLLGALISFFKSRKRARLYEEVTFTPNENALFNMSWQEFELLVEEYFRRRGYSTDHNGGGGADGGVDIVLTSKNEKYLVQCKQWKSQRLGVQAVRELHGVMAAQRAVGGFVVCAGRFTDEAKDFAQHVNIKLFDGPMLYRMISEVRQTSAQNVITSHTPATPVVPNCPKCGESMIKRMAHKGVHAGKEFWGCSAFPGCNGILNS